MVLLQPLQDFQVWFGVELAACGLGLVVIVRKLRDVLHWCDTVQAKAFAAHLAIHSGAKIFSPNHSPSTSLRSNSNIAGLSSRPNPGRSGTSSMPSIAAIGSSIYWFHFG